MGLFDTGLLCRVQVGWQERFYSMCSDAQDTRLNVFQDLPCNGVPLLPGRDSRSLEDRWSYTMYMKSDLHGSPSLQDFSMRHTLLALFYWWADEPKRIAQLENWDIGDAISAAKR